jgi:hypothetical protein
MHADFLHFSNYNYLDCKLQKQQNSIDWKCESVAYIRVIRKVCPEEEIEGKFHQNWS